MVKSAIFFFLFGALSLNTGCSGFSSNSATGSSNRQASSPAPSPGLSPSPNPAPSPLPNPSPYPAPSPAPAPTPSPSPSPAPSPSPPLGGHGQLRNWAHLANGTLVADDGAPLHGIHSHVNLPDDNYSGQWYRDVNWWHNIHDIGHFNFVRVTAYLGAWYTFSCSGSTCMTVDLLLPQLDIMVANAAQAGMYVLISDFSGNQIDETDWNLNSQLWAAVAPRYANNTNVIYEIKNEGNYTESMGVYAGHMQAAYLQIRAAAPNTPILVWSCAGGPCADTGVVAEAPQINYSNAVIAFHGYAPGYDYDGYVSQMNAAGYPVMMDEVNDNSNASYSSGWSLIMDMQNIGVSWGWLDGDGFCNAADNVAYGNCVTYINVTWPED